jgi:GNAT superfamily N-acetyltransferase
MGGTATRPWVAITRDGWTGPHGGEVSDALRADVQRLLAEAPASIDDVDPPVLADVAATLARELGSQWFVGGPVYVVPPDLSSPPPAGCTIVTSADNAEHDLVRGRRPVNWDEDEWPVLIDGELGPWAMALVEDRVASICHTPGLVANAAECGTWTHPDFRGRGLAAATVAAWAPLAAAPGRHLFYSTNDENLRSKQVAAHLGLRLVGRRWPFSPNVWTEADAWGRALDDWRRTVWVPTPELETDEGKVGSAMHPEWFFRSYDDWDWWERELLDAVQDGPVLDLGAGAGRVSLWFQERGFDVTAVDSSPGAISVCAARGVRDARVGDLNDPPSDKRWGAFLLLCGNLGLGGSLSRNRALLARLAELATDDAVLIGDTVEPDHDREFGLRIRYRGEATPWWRQYNIPVAKIPALVEGTGWRIDRHLVAGTDHAVLLRRALA